jgi:hypothetical protein
MLNHLEYFDHVADTYLRVLPELKQHTSSVYERPGVAIPLGMNQEGAAAACLSYRYTLCGSAYTGWLLAMRWRFCRDEEYFQRRMRPLLREFAEFYLASFSRVSDAPDAEYVLDWSVPPEIFSMTRNDNATLALLKTMLNIFVEACEFYGCEKALTARCRDLLAHYPALCKRPDGAWWCGPDIPLDHYMWCGHLCYPFFPSEADTDVRAAMATVNYMDNRGVERSYADPEIEFHLNHDWAWCLNVVSRQRCGDVEKSWAELGRFIRYFGK